MASPVATAWHRVHAASGASGRLQRASATLEIVLRLVAAVAVADYLRGPAEPRVEQHLEKLGRASLGTWLGLAREAVRAVHEREGPAPFVREAYEAWFDDKGRPSAALKRLDALVALRNDLQHGAAVGGDASDAAHAATFVEGLREVLASVHWLMRYRLLWVVDQAPTRGGTARGRVQLFTGQAPPEPVSAEWTARLFSDAVYLCNPAADAVLELSPLVAVLPEPQLGVVKPFLLHAVHKSGDLVLACDETGHTERVRAQHDGAPVTWAAWLEARGARDPVQANRDVAGTLTSALGGAPAPGASALGQRFVLGDQLGEGGMAVVYRAHDQVADSPVAIKMLRPEVAADPEIRARFKREAATMAAMRHPRVLSGVSIGEGEGGALFISMPLFEGGSVADRLAAGTAGPADRARWTRQLLEALVHLAEQRVVHRDIKPSNLLLDAAGDLVLADFGIALGARDARLTRTLTQLGSLAYMAPESRTGNLDFASDAYSAAIVLHELHTGALPRALPGDGIDGPVGAVVRALGALDPTDRPTAAAALAALDGTATAGLTPAVAEGTNDLRVATAAGVAGLLGAVCMVAPAVTSLPASVAPGWAWGLPGWVAWSGWAVALLLFALTGAWVARRAYGPPVPPAAAAGGVAALIAYGLGGVVSVAVAATLQVFRPATSDAVDLVASLGDLMLRLFLGGFAGALAAIAAGAVSAAAGGWAATRGATRPASRAVPDTALRWFIAPMLVFVSQLPGAVVGAAWRELGSSLLANARAAPGLDLLVGAIDVLPAGLFLLGSLAASWTVGAPLTEGFRSRRRTDRVNAWTFGVLFAVTPLGGFVATGLSPWGLVMALGCPVGAVALGAAYLRARALPPIAKAGTNFPASGGSFAASGAMLGAFGFGHVPIHVGLAAALLVVPSIGVLSGYQEPADPALALGGVLRLSGVTALGAIAGAAFVGAAFEAIGAFVRRRAGLPASLRQALIAGALGLPLTGAAMFGVFLLIRSGLAEPADRVVTGVAGSRPLLAGELRYLCKSERWDDDGAELLAALACPLAGQPPGELDRVLTFEVEPALSDAVGSVGRVGTDGFLASPTAVAAGLPASESGLLISAWIADQFPDAAPAGDPIGGLERAVGNQPLLDLLRVRATRRDRGIPEALGEADAAISRHPRASELKLLRLELLAEAGDPVASLAAAEALHTDRPSRLDVHAAYVAALLRARDPRAEKALAALGARRKDLDVWDEVRVVWALLDTWGPERAGSTLRAAIDERITLEQRASTSVLVRTLLVVAATHPTVAGELPFVTEWLAARAPKDPDLGPWLTWARGLAAGDAEAEAKAWPILADPANAPVWRVPCGADYARSRRRATTDPDALAAFARRAARRCADTEGRATFAALARREAAD